MPDWTEALSTVECVIDDMEEVLSPLQAKLFLKQLQVEIMDRLRMLDEREREEAR